MTWPIMKDYAKRNTTSHKPNRHREASRHFSFDHWLIVFIILTLALAALSASYTVYHNWLKEKEMHATQSEDATKPPPKSTIEKIFRKSGPEKRELHDNDKLKTAEKTAKTAKTAEKNTESKSLDTNEPKYDFYQLLPKMTVDVQSDNDEDTTSH